MLLHEGFEISSTTFHAAGLVLDLRHVQEFLVGGLIGHANPAYRLIETAISRLNIQILLAFLVLRASR